MKANELRIWNWIHDADGDGQVVKIEEAWVFTTSCNLELPLECFSGIPLTSEWLEKFGFVRGTGDDSDCWEQPFEKYPRRKKVRVAECWSVPAGVEETSENADYFVFFEHDAGCGFGSIRFVDYVHDFQNLFFALTEEELKAVGIETE